MSEYLFTSESVTEGGIPTKYATRSPTRFSTICCARTLTRASPARRRVTTGLVLVDGQITTKGYVDIPKIARGVIQDIGYDSSALGFDAKTCGIITAIDEQSTDIRSA